MIVKQLEIGATTKHIGSGTPLQFALTEGTLMDDHAAQATINEQYTTIKQLRLELASEKELADKLQFALNHLMRDYITKDLDPRTEEALSLAMGDYRAARIKDQWKTQ